MSRITLLPAADRAATPWKNGGGVTREVAAHPPGAGLEDFDWRVSLAEVASDGPFSVFPGVDRVLTVLAGRLSLTLADRAAPVVLAAGDEGLAFAGDIAARGDLVGGPVSDLNVMVRRGRIAAQVLRWGAPMNQTVGANGTRTLLLALGEATAQTGDAVMTLGPLDAALIEDGEAAVASAAPVFEIRLAPIAGTRPRLSGSGLGA